MPRQMYALPWHGIPHAQASDGVDASSGPSPGAVRVSPRLHALPRTWDKAFVCVASKRVFPLKGSAAARR